MRFTKFFFLTAGIISGLLSPAHAQDSVKLRYIITTQPTQYLFRDFGITIEKVLRRRTVGLLLSYRPATQNGGGTTGGHGGAGYYIDNNMFNRNYNAFTVGYTGKYFPKAGRNFFMEAAFFYRHWWFFNKQCNYDQGEGGYGFDALRTKWQNVYGLKLSLGETIYLRTKGRLKPIIEVFMGVGLRYKTYVFESWQGTVDGQYYDYLKERGNSWEGRYDKTALIPFSIQGGVRLGIGF